ncbi:MAG TPA: hypothetical protein VG326_16130 [Tepidisphaeraceae bacterium]|nr:hypothetical protein [Tepidisphaeraceae bacterium]
MLLSISSAQPVNFSATAGAQYSGPVATFTDSDPDASASDYSVSITYGNGAASSGFLSGYAGAWTVSDSQTFMQAGTLPATVNIYDTSDGSNASVTDAGTVAPAPISLNASNESTMVGQDSSQTIATLNDSAASYATGNYSASLSVNGSSFPVTFSPEDSNGDYVVQADLTGLGAGSYSASLNVTESTGGQTVSASTNVSIDVAEQPILVTASGSINATVGVPWSGTVATFDPQDANASVANYTATINYGNGSSDTGFISGLGDSFTVSDSQTFSAAGNLWPTITIADAAQSVSATAAATIGLSSISLTPAAPALTAYQTFTGVVGSLTDSAGADSLSNNLSVSVTLAGTTYPLSLASDNGGDYSLVLAGLPALTPGTYSAHLYAQEASGTLAENTAADFDVTVSDTPITASGVAINAVVGVPWSGAIANFTHDDFGDPSQFTAVTSWGDSTSPTAGTVSGNSFMGGDYTVNDAHAFSGPGTFWPTTTISDSAGTTAAATSSATVGMAPISLSAAPFSPVEGQSFKTRSRASSRRKDTFLKISIPVNHLNTE